MGNKESTLKEPPPLSVDHIVHLHDKEQIKQILQRSRGRLDDAMHSAALYGRADVIEILHFHGRGASSLSFQIAAEHGHLNVIEMFIRLDAETAKNCLRAKSSFKMTPWHFAALFGYEDIIEAFGRLDTFAIDDVNSGELTALHLAVLQGHASTVKALLQLGSRAADTPFTSSSMRLGVTTLPLRFARRQVPFNKLGAPFGTKPVHVAALQGRIDVIEVLSQFGTDEAVASLDREGNTAISVAAQHGRIEVIEALIRLGSQAIDTPNKYGETPMYYAALHGTAELVEALVRLGSRALDVCGRNGRSPLHVAVERDKIEVVRSLIRLGCQVEVLDDSGNSPWDRAVAHSSNQSLELLTSLGFSPVRQLIDEDCILQARYELFFSRSLAHRLFTEGLVM